MMSTLEKAARSFHYHYVGSKKTIQRKLSYRVTKFALGIFCSVMLYSLKLFCSNTTEIFWLSTSFALSLSFALFPSFPYIEFVKRNEHAFEQKCNKLPLLSILERIEVPFTAEIVEKALHFFKLTPANPAVEFQNERLENKVEKVLLRFCFAAMDAKGFL